MIGQRLRPERIDLEVRRLHSVPALARELACDEKAGRREDEQQEDGSTMFHRKPPERSGRIIAAVAAIEMERMCDPSGACDWRPLALHGSRRLATGEGADRP